MDIVNLVSDEENESLEDSQKLLRSEISDNVITQKDDLEVFTISDTSEDEDDIYVCPECRKEYNGEQYLERHMKREHNLNADDYKVFGN
uniref:C2H2-type domain-containing protein n=1 Tax=Lutzomyia longipalpis TaxID=7200 RepID=A0A1B0GJN8_LUTLO